MTHTKESLLLRLSTILLLPSIKPHIDEIEDIRYKLLDKITDVENLNITNEIKAKVQKEANEAIDRNNGKGAVLMATGTGKSKVAIDRACNLINTVQHNSKSVLLVVPTEKLRDEGWKNEFTKWGNQEDWSYVEATCYASLNTYVRRDWDLIILDEGHNITENNAQFFFSYGNSWKEIILLTATKPTSQIKIDILTKLGVFPVYTLSLDEAIKLGITANYEVTIVQVPLDNKHSYIKSGNKEKTFYQTELAKYNWLSRNVLYTSNPLSRIARMQFIGNLKSKNVAAQFILANVIPDKARGLIFCGSKEQADLLCEHRYYSKPTKPQKPRKDTLRAAEKYVEGLMKYETQKRDWQGDDSLEGFKIGDIDRMSCVMALNEGHNVADDLDYALIAQLNSKELDLIQRMGRVLRFRVGHTGKIIIICSKDTIDVDWVKKAIRRLDINKIRWIEYEDLLSKKEQINFN